MMITMEKASRYIHSACIYSVDIYSMQTAQCIAKTVTTKMVIMCVIVKGTSSP